MRVLLVNDSALEDGWGAEAVIRRLAEGLVAAGDEVEVFAGQVEHEGLRKAFDVWDPQARRALAHVAASFRPDVVHHNNILRELSVSVLGIPRGAGMVLTAHDLRLFGVPDGTTGAFQRGLIAAKGRFDVAVARRNVHVAIGVSREVARRLSDAGFEAVEHVPIIGPASSVTSSPVGASHDVVFAGRLSKDKGAHVLVEAFARVASRHPGARLVLAGDGPERSALEAAASGLGDRVSFLGRVSARHVQELMANARVIVAPVIPSIRPEGAGLTPVEAGLLGRPSIVSDDRALREFVDDSDGGIVVRGGDRSELAGALDRILGDAALAETLGENARRNAVERYSVSAVVPQVRAIYGRAVDAASRSAR